jgi:hypothetical protein
MQLMQSLRTRLHSATVAIALAFIACVFMAQPAHAQYKSVATQYQYSVKTICTLFTNIGFGDAFAPGRYRTVINIHNPTEKKIEIARKFALAGAPGEEVGDFSITPYKSLTLIDDQAISFNCFDISSFYCPIRGVCVDFTAIDGFLVINSPVELDVVAVYSANPTNAEVSTLHTEIIPARRIVKNIAIQPEKPLIQPQKRIQMDHMKRKGQ